MYYNPYPYFVYPNYYPTWVMANQPTTQHSRYLAMPTNRSPFPPINTNKLKTSAKRIKTIMQQAQLLTDKIDESEQFAHDLIDAAQQSNKTEVEKLIASTGITIKFETTYTPDGLRIIFTESSCCKLTLLLGW
ncbi:hypothetical protein [Lysinibacillus sp. BPa_S21]|uniref:hypothetical protein n=1 Tax=Lysinibacillus sp. BPa_S21 TaxID=2932478 RepID=UPI0020135393|nr:hypothetical protein [Lysinibacillus sp. BPa_S21]MCL1697221.1 hypothetical protein [Lysinibacillus sp. BPa_S21]